MIYKYADFRKYTQQWYTHNFADFEKHNIFTIFPQRHIIIHFELLNIVHLFQIAPEVMWLKCLLNPLGTFFIIPEVKSVLN